MFLTVGSMEANENKQLTRRSRQEFAMAIRNSGAKQGEHGSNRPEAASSRTGLCKADITWPAVNHAGAVYRLDRLGPDT